MTQIDSPHGASALPVIIHLTGEITGRPVTEIFSDMSFEQMGISTIDLVNLIVRIERHLSIELYDDDLEGLENLLDLASVVDNTCERTNSTKSLAR